MGRIAFFLLAACTACSGREVDIPVAHTEGPGKLAATNIEHVVVIEQENHTFDNYFGDRCEGPPGVTCTAGWSCCESIWGTNARWSFVATQDSPAVALTNITNGCSDPNHGANAELLEMSLGPNGFQMNAFPPPSNDPCADGTNVVSTVARDAGVLDTYFRLAAEGALADRYFQPIVGASTANDMFFARAAFVYQDNYAKPNNVKGGWCAGYHTATTVDAPNADIGSYNYLREYQDPTLGDWLADNGISWAVYMEGYEAAAAFGYGSCPDMSTYQYPNFWDPADNPFNFYPRFRDDPTYNRDFSTFAADVDAGTLPNVVFIRSLGTTSEHPANDASTYPTTLSDGQAFVDGIVDQIENSALYASNTLILITWDEGGGFYDHVPPPLVLADGTPLLKSSVTSPNATTTDGKARPATADEPECFRCLADPNREGQLFYGTRIPLIATGPFAQAGSISHVVMGHSSIVKFIEWNFLGKVSGQLNGRDKHVNNIGSLLTPDLAVIGAVVPTGVAD